MTNRTNKAKATEHTLAEKRATSKILALVLVLLTAAINTTLAQGNDAWKGVKSVKETPSETDAEDAVEEAKYLKELTELLAKNGIKDPAQQAQLLIKRGKDVETENGGWEYVMAFQFWDAAKVWLALGIPPIEVRDLMPVYAYVLIGFDNDKHPEDSDLLSGAVEGTERIDPETGLLDWDMGKSLNAELPEIIGDAIMGKQAAAKRLHVDGLQNLQPKDRCARLIQVLTKRYKARAQRERERLEGS
jgi:hypothetical protein